MSRCLPLLLVAVLAWPSLAKESCACPFCNAEGQTLTKEVNLASLVIFGKIENGSANLNYELEGWTDFVVEKVIKGHDILDKELKKRPELGGKEGVRLSRLIPKDDKKSYKYVVFCDVFKGKIDPYRLMRVETTSDPSEYLSGALAVKDKSQPERLKFFFKHLDDAEIEISTDAYKEFAYADYKDYQGMAKDLPADKLAVWIQDEKTPTFRLGLYASLLGHAGTAEHAKVLRKLLDDPTRRLNAGVDGILAGYVLLQPKEGWDYVCATLRDDKKDFSTRYAALRTARFFHDFRPDVVAKKDVIDAVALLLDSPDVADLAIEDLRKWQVWDHADRILALKEKDSHDIPIIKRSILRYALQCPKDEAKSFVAERRKKDLDGVQQQEELLKLEATPITLPQPAAAAKTK